MGGLEHVVSLATAVGVPGDIYINSRVVIIMLGGVVMQAYRVVVFGLFTHCIARYNLY